MRVIVVVLLLVTFSLQDVRGLQTKLLDLRADDVRVTATAECGVPTVSQYTVCSGDGGECLRTCGRSGDEVIAHNAELSVDGDSDTSWQSPSLSFYQALGETITSHNLTIDIGRAVHIVAIQVWSGESEFPAGGLELYISLNGVDFTLVASLTPQTGEKAVIVSIVNISRQQQQLTIQQRADSHARYLQLGLLAPPTSLVTFDLRSVFYSVSEIEIIAVEEEACPTSLIPSQECYGEAISRRTLVNLQDPALHRLLWQRSNQSDVWIMDDVIVIVDECIEYTVGECELERVKEDFNGSLNSILWDSDSFPDSAIIGPRPCPDLDDDPALLITPGDQIITRPLTGGSDSIIFDVEFPSLPIFCKVEYLPVEIRVCRSIVSILGECELIALISTSDCGNCLDQLTFELRYLQEGLESARFPGNLTILDDLHTDIHSTLEDLMRLEVFIIILHNVVIGTVPLPPYIPHSVPRLDLQLMPSILTKLEDLRRLLDQMPIIPVVIRDDLIDLYSELKTRLQSLLEDGVQLRTQQRALTSMIVTLLRSVSENVDAVSVAMETANQILVLISSKDYLDIEVKVQGLVNETQLKLEFVNIYLELTQNNTQLSQDLSNRLMGIGDALVTAGNLATETVGVVNDALSVVVVTKETLQMVQTLLNEAIDLLSRGEDEVRDGEVAIATGEQLLQQAINLSQLSLGAVSNITSLTERVNQSILFDRPRLANFLLITGCPISGLDNCTEGEEHGAELGIDHTYLVNSSISVYTVQHAIDTLDALGTSGMPLDTSLINNTALSAQEIAQNAIKQLATINSTQLGGVVSIVLLSARQLSEIASTVSSMAISIQATVNASNDRVDQLESILGGQQIELVSLVDSFGGVVSLEDVSEEAILILDRANDSLNVVKRSEVRVENVREGSEEVDNDIIQITDNVQNTDSILQDTQQKFPLVVRLLEATESQAQAALSNITSFLNKNERILRDIDSLIARLSDVHASVALINSPIRLSSEPSLAVNNTLPYLSLQPPPGRQLGDAVQFEDFDLYMWPSAQYQTPNLLFYAGPVRFPDQQNRTQPETQEDVVWIVAEDNQLRLGWELGGYHANKTYPAQVDGESRLRLTRVGSQFKLQLSPSSLPTELVESSPINNSLLFHTSSQTAFLLGGWPQGAELGSEVMPLPLSSLHGFEGQFQLALFNGDIWGLWNVRSSSDTDLIGRREFRRNSLSSHVTWHGTSGLRRTASVLSFSGSGYLFTQQFSTMIGYSTNAVFQIMEIFLRPNDASRGLVMYAYQIEESISLEVFFRDGFLNVLISRHDDIGSEVVVNHSEVASPSGDEEVQLLILYDTRENRYTINRQLYDMEQFTTFFTNLQQVKAWFGGVQLDQVESTYIPHETRGYFGCLDLFIRKNLDIQFEIFRGSIFTQYYLNSPIQFGLSATCYATVYVHEVSFDVESEGVAYTYLPFPPRSSPCTPSLPLSISLSILSLDKDGVILTAIDQENSVSIVLRNNTIQVIATVNNNMIIISSETSLEIQTWHHILISFSNIQQMMEMSLFVNGILQDEVILPNGFTLDLPTSAPVGVANPAPVLYIGGVNTDVTMATFTGCMRDLTFDICPLSFHGPSLVDPYPPGVNYHTCPSSTTSSVPLLPVQSDPPIQSVCLEESPIELTFTHGGFAKDTTLETSNIIGLYGNQWNLTFALRQRNDGHVITVRSVSGECVTVSVVDRGRLDLTVSSGGGVSQNTSTTDPLSHDIFTAVTIECAVLSPYLECNMTVNNQQAVSTTVLVNASIFDPALPIIIGYTQDKEVDSFEGCISDLAINGDKSGFIGVSTDVPCYNETVTGIGFIGTSFISEVLPIPDEVNGDHQVNITLTLRPSLETGVVLVLTTPTATPTGAEPVLAIGLVQGELRVSNNFSSGGDYSTLAVGLCNPANEMTFELSLTVTNNDVITVGVANGDVITLPLSLSKSTGLIMTVGNIPGSIRVIDWSFLVGSVMLPNAQPAGLVGCLLMHSVQGRPFNLNINEHNNLLIGFCPDD